MKEEKISKPVREDAFTVTGKVVESDKNGDLHLEHIKIKDIKRVWEPLDWDFIENTVGHCNRFEIIMCTTQCKTNEDAIKAILKYRKAQKESNSYIASLNKENHETKYLRTHYNDLEDDNFERQEIRCLNG